MRGEGGLDVREYYLKEMYYKKTKFQNIWGRENVQLRYEGPLQTGRHCHVILLSTLLAKSYFEKFGCENNLQSRSKDMKPRSLNEISLLFLSIT